MLCFITSYQGTETRHEIDADEIVLGRPGPGISGTLDLRPDRTISRQHGRLWRLGSNVYFEDLGSTHGTTANGRALMPGERFRFRTDDTLCLGATHLQLAAESPAPTEQATPAAAPTERASHPTDPNLKVTDIIERHTPPSEVMLAGGDGDTLPLGPLYETPTDFAACRTAEELAEQALAAVRRILPAAQSGCFLTRPDSEKALVLVNHFPKGEALVSTSLADYTIDNGTSVLWRRRGTPPPEGLELGQSFAEYDLQCVLGSPLVHGDDVLGAIIVNNCRDANAFSRADLGVLTTISRYAAMHLGSLRMQEALRQTVEITQRLFTAFSPRVRDRLLARAQLGRLQPGGDRSEITVLSADIRGFSKLASEVEAAEVLELLNAYFPALTDCIFRHDGTVDKFAGDAVLGVFGSPEPDPQQHRNAVLAAVEMQNAMDRLSQQRDLLGQRTCRIGVGVHCGEALHGLVGSVQRLEFTVIGDSVNLACRYGDGAGPGDILLSPDHLRPRLAHAARGGSGSRHQTRGIPHSLPRAKPERQAPQAR